MGAPKSDNNLQTENRTSGPPRAPLVWAAIFCWLAAIIGIAAATYAYSSTPKVMSIPYEFDGKITETHGKFEYLISPSLGVLFAPLIMSYYLVTWKRFKRAMVERERRWRELAGDAYPLSMSGILFIVHVGFCIWQVITLSILLYRCSNLLSTASNKATVLLHIIPTLSP